MIDISEHGGNYGGSVSGDVTLSIEHEFIGSIDFTSLYDRITLTSDGIVAYVNENGFGLRLYSSDGALLKELLFQGSIATSTLTELYSYKEEYIITHNYTRDGKQDINGIKLSVYDSALNLLWDIDFAGPSSAGTPWSTVFKEKVCFSYNGKTYLLSLLDGEVLATISQYRSGPVGLGENSIMMSTWDDYTNMSFSGTINYTGRTFSGNHTIHSIGYLGGNFYLYSLYSYDASGGLHIVKETNGLKTYASNGSRKYDSSPTKFIYTKTGMWFSFDSLDYRIVEGDDFKADICFSSPSISALKGIIVAQRTMVNDHFTIWYRPTSTPKKIAIAKNKFTYKQVKREW